jgi:hypothetical protein
MAGEVGLAMQAFRSTSKKELAVAAHAAQYPKKKC